jgi:putative phosphoribosyl transferase
MFLTFWQSLERENMSTTTHSEVKIAIAHNQLQGFLALPDRPRGLVIFAHGSGSSRFSERNQEVARRFNDRGLATLLFDLLTSEEEELDRRSGRYRFNIALLAHRLVIATKWAKENPELAGMKIGYFGASTGAAAALVAAVEMPDSVVAVVSRGGRVDLAGGAFIHELRAPILLIAGSADYEIVRINRRVIKELKALHRLKIIDGATHLFSEPGTLQEAADHAAHWFLDHFPVSHYRDSSSGSAGVSLSLTNQRSRGALVSRQSQ